MTSTTAPSVTPSKPVYFRIGSQIGVWEARIRPTNMSSATVASDDIWELDTGAEPSTVGIPDTGDTGTGDNSGPQYRPELRSSTSIRNAFTCTMPSMLKQLFSKVTIGIGSKHIYHKGDFVKEHHDTQKPPLVLNGEELPHIMTLVLTDSISELQVCGEKVPLIEQYCWSAERKYAVLFSLDCPHEVLPVQSEKRNSFTFPVYGVYTGLTLPKPVASIAFMKRFVPSLALPTSIRFTTLGSSRAGSLYWRILEPTNSFSDCGA